MFVAALAVPEAFGSEGVVFGVAFLIVNVMYLTLYALGGARRPGPAGGDPAQRSVGALRRGADRRGGVRRRRPQAGALAGRARSGLVRAAVAGSSGWRVQPAHFVERHGLIVIIAIGESLVAIGIGARGVGLGVGVIVAAVLGLLVATAFWLAYFDFFTIRGRAAAHRPERRRARRARARRLHLSPPADDRRHRALRVRHEADARARERRSSARSRRSRSASARRSTCPHTWRCACAFRARSAAAACSPRWPARCCGRSRLVVPALVALALVAAVWVALHAYELIWWREARAEARAMRPPASAS